MQRIPRARVSARSTLLRRTLPSGTLGASFLAGAALLCLPFVAAALWLLCAGGVADAGRPPPPPPESGVIYYQVGFDTCWRMNADGSQKTLVLSNVWLEIEPSEHLHGGSRWFLTVLSVDGTYPSGDGRRELFAVSETGATVQLSDDPTLEPMPVELPTGLWKVQPRWTIDDSRVSYQARRWSVDPGTGAPEVVDVGLFAIDLTLEVHQVTAPVAPCRVPVDIQISTDSGYPSTTGSGLDWSPDGSAVAYIYQGAVRVADAETGQAVELPLTPVSPYGFRCVRWSPDGSRLIVEDSFKAIGTCAPDGSGFKVVAASNRKTNVQACFWSPSGANILFERRDVFKSGAFFQECNLIRAPASGGSEVDLTTDISGWTLLPLGWRAAQ